VPERVVNWRTLYSWAWRVATPLARRYLKKRGQAAPAYLEHWDERFGSVFEPQAQDVIWLHAVSVGETRAAQPLIAALRAAWPEAPLLVTQMTPTGRATAQALYPDAEVRYLPYDLPRAVQGFVAAYRPRLGVLMETELWPNLIHAAHSAGVPLFLANARLSEKSFHGYRRVAGLIRPALRELAGVAAQTDADAQRLAKLGAQQVEVCGNTKYDVSPPEAQLALGATFKRWIGARPVLVAASTRDGEEQLLLEAWRAYRGEALLVIVPRHPERFGVVAELAREMGFATSQRSATQGELAAAIQVWIGDSMGELFGYYVAADAAFIGGSLLPLGGQNLIEPACLGVPVLFGPSMFNFQQASEWALAAGAAQQVHDAPALVQAFQRLLADPVQRASMRAGACAFSSAHRGASERMVAFIKRRLAEEKT
jgi:3-deoxy-D-manno-octulosonic-acid transferase